MNKKIVYIPQHKTDAGKWIYEGFGKAWNHLGFESIYYVPKEVESLKKDSYIMSCDSHFIEPRLYSKFDKVFLYVMNQFSDIFQGHPNFTSQVSSDNINRINNMKNVIKFNFGLIEPKYIGEWNDVEYIPLAFDNLSYKNLHTGYLFDVCFVGGIAHNGVNTKISIMKEYLGAFKESGLKCGFFINKNLTHEQENKILCNSRVCLNIHDKIQHLMGLDTNERTFKSLGCGGILVSDNIRCLSHPPLDDLKIFSADSPSDMVEKCKKLLGNNSIDEIRKYNFEEIKNHTYISRVKQLLNKGE